MSKQLLALCGLPKQADRDGATVPYAKLLLPFLDYLWFADGSVGDFPGTTIGQYQGITLSGSVKPNVFHKDCCSCIGNDLA